MLSYDIPKCALVVANDFAALESIGATCRRGGFAVSHAHSDLDAVRSLELGPPGLVVIDVCRQDDALLEWGRKLRAQPRTARLPILATCAHADADMAVTALDAGMDDCVARPFSSNELLARISVQRQST